MAKVRNSDRPKKSGRTGPAPTVVEVRCNPASDARGHMPHTWGKPTGRGNPLKHGTLDRDLYNTTRLS